MTLPYSHTPTWPLSHSDTLVGTLNGKKKEKHRGKKGLGKKKVKDVENFMLRDSL